MEIRGTGGINFNSRQEEEDWNKKFVRIALELAKMADKMSPEYDKLQDELSTIYRHIAPQDQFDATNIINGFQDIEDLDVEIVTLNEKIARCKDPEELAELQTKRKETVELKETTLGYLVGQIEEFSKKS